GGKNSLNRLIRCVCGKKIGPDPRNFNQRVSLGRNDLLIRTFPRITSYLRQNMLAKTGLKAIIRQPF
ncbi:EAL domain-containing protein, partial [Enterobacter hormaechei]